MHEIRENMPFRERFVIPRDNIPNKRCKQLREQFMGQTRLVLKESEHEPWCKRYLELYNELRENWEKPYWDEGYSKKHGLDHANYDYPEDDDDHEDFNPYRTRQPRAEQIKHEYFFSRVSPNPSYVSTSAFAPMNGRDEHEKNHPVSKNEPLDINRYISESENE